MARRKAPSAAEGKRFGTTTITPEKSQFDIQGVLTKYGVEASQWTMLADRWVLRFRLNERNYLFTIRKDENDPQEVRRLFRVLFWYLDTLLAAFDSDLFTPEKVLLAFAEVAPDVTMHEAMESSNGYAGLRTALGGAPLMLEAGNARVPD